ncbi:hypothetical protein Hypma_003467 [Hypsizygus marmoreus]|uniref:Uncharacterized protein n=1 Tax=Hypsizygus marmoreus TaxID=39966 RepID=A0A369JAZ5_HYPMA|nr:hypothetical protein Hypma_003467 [Hypsizygus marmoreus]
MSQVDIQRIQPTDLINNPDLLIHAKGREETRTVFDGKVGSVVEEGRYFVMSPNVGHTYYPPLGRNREVRLWKNYRFAEDDYLCGPQPYLSQYCHLAAIPRQPKDHSEPLAIMWWMPTKEDFEISPTNVITGIGKLHPRQLNAFRRLVVAISKQVEDYKFDTKFPDKKQPLIALATALDHTFDRLESLSTSFRQMQFSVAALQRCYLEVKAYLDYLHVYHPMMTGQAPPATSLARTIGAYVHDPVVLQEFVRAGLPVWVTRSFDAVPSTRIDCVKPARLPQQWAVVADATPPFKPFFTGAANDPNKYIAFGRFARSFMGYPNPFADPLPLPSPSQVSTLPASGPSRTASSSNVANNRVGAQVKKLQPYPSQKPQLQGASKIEGRNKFVDPPSLLLPPPISAWCEALAAVDRDKANLMLNRRPSDAGYVFPEPGLFVGVAIAEKTSNFIHNWLRNRAALIYRVSSESSSARPVTPQLWRTLLNYGGIVGVGGAGETTLNDKRRREVEALLGNCIEEDGVQLSSSGVAASMWREQELQPGVLPSLDITHAILWELFELNFRFEFIALDARMTTVVEQDLATRQMLIAACFPGVHGGSLLVANIDFMTRG